MDSYLKYWGKAKQGDGEEEPYHLLAYHCLDVAAIGHVLLEKHQALSKQLSNLTGLEEHTLKDWAVFFLALHDIGKFSDCFQNLVPELLSKLQLRSSDKEYSERHDSLGYLLWNEVLRDLFIQLEIMPPKLGKRRGTSSQQKAINNWIGAVTGHHGEPPKQLQIVLNNYFNIDQDFAAIKEYVSEIVKLFVNGQSFPECEPEKLELASWWLSGFAVLCDWLGSNNEYFTYTIKETELDKYWQRAIKQANRAISETGLLAPIPSQKLTLKQIIQAKDVEKIKATPLQKLAQTITLNGSTNLIILEDVTGAGKTEAAVILAHRMMQQESISGVFFALPTMATANAMYTRMSKAYNNFYQAGSKPSLVLAHGASRLSEEFTHSIIPIVKTTRETHGDNTTTAEAHCNQWLADNRKKSLLADIGVGTIDQALLAILPSRHQSLRLLGLLNKVLIVDEVHACDTYMHELLCSSLKAHAASGGSAILLSATLPEMQRQKFINAYAEGKQWQKLKLKKTGEKDYPLLTLFNKDEIKEKVIETRKTVKRTVNIKLVHSQDKIEKLFTKVVEKNQCACWIRNTVLDARESFEYLKKKYPEWKIDLFHARFTMGDRLEIEGQVLDNFGKDSRAEERAGKILIATQVVEQSLDADWDEMVTDLVPIDMVIQRAGRLRRHTRDLSGNRIEGKDQRGQAVLHIYSPELLDKPTTNWYADFFKRSQYVYENHGQLWLTANLLQKRAKIQMPEDARILIEGVYSDEARAKIPELLQERDWDAEGTSKAEASLAKANALKFDVGYSSNAANRWWDEAITPTRLGDETISLYLARWESGKLSPWSHKTQHAWSYSSVSVKTYWVKQEAIRTDISPKQIERCKDKLPAKGKWGVLVPLTEMKNDLWQGIALNEAGELVTVQYTKLSGLVVNDP